MIKLWRVDVQLEYTVVVAADTREMARELAEDNYADSVEPERWVHESEIFEGRDVPEGWADSVPYCEDESALYDHLSELEDEIGVPEEECGGESTVERILWLREELARVKPQRCERTPDMFTGTVDKSPEVTAVRQSGKVGK